MIVCIEQSLGKEVTQIVTGIVTCTPGATAAFKKVPSSCLWTKLCTYATHRHRFGAFLYKSNT